MSSKVICIFVVKVIFLLKIKLSLYQKYHILFALLLLVNSTTFMACETTIGELDEEEVASESLSNTFLGMSWDILHGDREGVESVFSPRLEAAAFPDRDPRFTPVDNGIETGSWTPTTRPSASTSEQVVADLDRFLDRFRELRDLRFKVKNSEQIDDATRAEVKFYMIGRDASGARNWVKGIVDVMAERDESGRWKVSRWSPKTVTFMRARLDLFSEVSREAGVLGEIEPSFAELNRRFGELEFHYGAAACDVNGDGLMDVVTSSYSRMFLYMNRGDGTFYEAAEEAGLADLKMSSGVICVDFDNDGDSDISVTGIGLIRFRENRTIAHGAPRFVDVADRDSSPPPEYGTSIVAGDMNRDALPDLYVVSWTKAEPSGLREFLENGVKQAGTENRLYINRGSGEFLEQADEWNVDDSGAGNAALLIDVNDDARLDLLVGNDFGEETRAFENQGSYFEERSDQWGLGAKVFNMGIAPGDWNNDGRLDLLYTAMSSTAGNRILARVTDQLGDAKQDLRTMVKGNLLFFQDADGRFQDVTDKVGPLSAGWAYGGGATDWNNDGWEDIFCPNGFISGESWKDT